MPGPPRKPRALKLISGTLQPCRDVADVAGVSLPAVTAAPRARDWPHATAAAEWERLAPMLIKNRLLTEGGLSLLAMLCNLRSIITRALAGGVAPRASLLIQHRRLSADFALPLDCLADRGKQSVQPIVSETGAQPTKS